MSDGEVRRIAEKLAEILETKAEKKRKKDTEEKRISENWTTGETTLVCRPCLLYNRNPEVPAHFKVGVRGASGTVQRFTQAGALRNLSAVKEKCKRHELSNLHIWCEARAKREEGRKTRFEERNTQAGMQVVRTAIKTIKRGQGAADFLADLDFQSLSPGAVFAVKNNSKGMFFDLRESIFEVVCQKMRDFFHSNIKNIAVSLDKVTIHHTSYTIITTYFFWEGKLHIVANELRVLTLNDYDSEGTAKMVVASLCSTLGYSRTGLAHRLRHCTYDGVYASPEERVAGGGCLSLVDNVTELLGLDKGDITGIWDVGHNLQVRKSK